jgi:hypothetical protein
LLRMASIAMRKFSSQTLLTSSKIEAFTQIHYSRRNY